MKTAFLHRLRPLLVFWPIVIFGIFLPGSAHAAFGDIFKPEFRTEPSNEVTGEPENVYFLFACYCIVAGELTPIPCTFEYRITGLAPPANPVFPCDPDDPNGERTCVTGGHSHNGARPLVFDPPGKVKFDADELPFDKLAVKGNTLATPPLTLAKVTHTVPQASGVLRITGFLTMPRIGRTRWFCVTDNCFDFNGMVFDGTVDVRVRNLRQLRGKPGQVTPDHYVKGRNPDDKHIDAVAFSASPLTLQALPLLSNLYFSVTPQQPLSVNDISLPKGGVFDLALDWDGRNDHKEHRDGKDVDINRAGIDCQDDQRLQFVVDRLLVGVLRTKPDGSLKRDPVTGEPHPFSALFCESNGNKHIDFTRFVVPPVI